MSGGHYEYKYSKLADLAHEIDCDLDNIEKECGNDSASQEEKSEMLSLAKTLIEQLRTCSVKAKALEWFMSGDIGSKECLKRMKEADNQKIEQE